MGFKNIEKSEALSIIFDCAERYKKCLLNTTLLFIYIDSPNKTNYFEVTFTKSNFMHLTGVKTPLNANLFFNACINKRLKESDFNFAEDGTTRAKMIALPNMMYRDVRARMIGTYDVYRPKLITERITGGAHNCMGFIRDDVNDDYFPNTVLLENIKNLSNAPKRIILTLQKGRKEQEYFQIVFRAKEYDFSQIRFPKGYEYLSQIIAK